MSSALTSYSKFARKTLKIHLWKDIFSFNDSISKAFQTITNDNNIQRLYICLEHLDKLDDSNLAKYQKILRQYIEALGIFSSALQISGRDLERFSVFRELLGFLQLEKQRRQAIPPKAIKKRLKFMTNAYVFLEQELRKIFYDRANNQLRVKAALKQMSLDSIKAFILDEHVGLGKEYRFGKGSNSFSFTKRLLSHDFDRQHTMFTLHCLLHRKKNIREMNDAILVLGGQKKTACRIHIIRKESYFHLLDRPLVARLYCGDVDKEHKQHEIDYSSKNLAA